MFLLFVLFLGKILQHADNLLQVIFLPRLDEVYLSYFGLPTLVDDWLQFLPELYFVQSLEFVIYDNHKFIGCIV